MYIGHQKESLKTGGLLKNYSQVCVFWLFLKLIFGSDIWEVQHIKPRQDIWKPGKWNGKEKKSQIKRCFFLKDFFASKKCKVIERNICIYLCLYLCSKHSRLWKEPWNLKLKVKESWCHGSVILSKLISMTPSFLIWKIWLRWKNNWNANHVPNFQMCNC